jgi:hypothetical protein
LVSSCTSVIAAPLCRTSSSETWNSSRTPASPAHGVAGGHGEAGVPVAGAEGGQAADDLLRDAGDHPAAGGGVPADELAHCGGRAAPPRKPQRSTSSVSPPARTAAIGATVPAIPPRPRGPPPTAACASPSVRSPTVRQASTPKVRRLSPRRAAAAPPRARSQAGGGCDDAPPPEFVAGPIGCCASVLKEAFQD